MFLAADGVDRHNFKTCKVLEWPLTDLLNFHLFLLSSGVRRLSNVSSVRIVEKVNMEKNFLGRILGSARG